MEASYQETGSFTERNLPLFMKSPVLRVFTQIKWSFDTDFWEGCENYSDSDLGLKDS